MNARRHACITFIGEVERDSRILRFIDALAETHKVTVISASAEQCDEQRGNFRLISLDVLGHGSLKLALLRFMRSARRIIRTIDVDLFIASDLYSLPAAASGARAMKKPLIYDSRELYRSIAALHRRPITQRFWNAVERYSLRFATAITTVNESIADILRTSYSSIPVTVIHNYPMLRDFTPSTVFRTRLGIDPTRPILLSLGGMQEGRGAFALLDAMKRLPQCALVFLGDGPLKEKIQLRASGLEMNDRVFVLDAVPSSAVLEYASSADVGCCLIEEQGESYHFALPNKLFEYIAAGLPVVASDLPEIRRVVNDSGVGVLVRPGDAASIADGVHRLLHDRTFADRCRESCTHARTVFNWSREREKLVALIDAITRNERL